MRLWGKAAAPTFANRYIELLRRERELLEAQKLKDKTLDGNSSTENTKSNPSVGSYVLSLQPSDAKGQDNQEALSGETSTNITADEKRERQRSQLQAYTNSFLQITKSSSSQGGDIAGPQKYDVIAPEIHNALWGKTFSPTTTDGYTEFPYKFEREKEEDPKPLTESTETHLLQDGNIPTQQEDIPNKQDFHEALWGTTSNTANNNSEYPYSQLTPFASRVIGLKSSAANQTRRKSTYQHVTDTMRTGRIYPKLKQLREC